MEDVIRKLKRNGRKGELSDDDEEAAAAALYESAEECWDKIDAESAMIWVLVAVHALKRAHDIARVSPEKLMPVVEAMLKAELEDG